MVNLYLLAGGYSSTIITYLFNSTAGSLAVTSTANVGINPSWLAKHATQPIIYAVNEIEDGALQSFYVKSGGVLSSAVDTISSGGWSPCHAAHLRHSSQVAVMNYVSGNGRIINLADGGAKFDHDNVAQVTFAPSTVVSHPHQAVWYGNLWGNQEIFVPDLGQDKIFRVSLGGQIHGHVVQPAGSGPRHIAITNNRIFTLHELDNTLTVQALPPRNVTSSPILAKATITPQPLPSGAKYGAAELLIPPATIAFPKRYIYVSNRNIGTPTPEGDSIVIYEHIINQDRTETLQLVKHVYTGILQPRGLEFVTTSTGEQYLAVGGVAGTGGVAIFKRTDGGRDLVEVARNRDIPTRTSFVWV